jgi:hypothetical protein
MLIHYSLITQQENWKSFQSTHLEKTIYLNEETKNNAKGTLNAETTIVSMDINCTTT